MAIVNEQIVIGRKFRKCIDEINKIWERISFWTKSSDVEFEYRKTAEIKLEGINGITSDLNCEDDTIAVNAKAVREVSANLPFALGIDADGNYGYIKEGADTVTPFKGIKSAHIKARSEDVIVWNNSSATSRTATATYVTTKKCNYMAICAASPSLSNFSASASGTLAESGTNMRAYVGTANTGVRLTASVYGSSTWTYGGISAMILTDE